MPNLCRGRLGELRCLNSGIEFKTMVQGLGLERILLEHIARHNRTCQNLALKSCLILHHMCATHKDLQGSGPDVVGRELQHEVQSLPIISHNLHFGGVPGSLHLSGSPHPHLPFSHIRQSGSTSRAPAGRGLGTRQSQAANPEK